jgi:hypothetical protein
MAKRAHQKRGKPNRREKPLRRARLRRAEAEASTSLERWVTLHPHALVHRARPGHAERA